MEELKLIELTHDNIPEEKVFAGNIYNHWMVGWIGRNSIDGEGDFVCNNNFQTNANITHYIRIPKIH